MLYAIQNSATEWAYSSGKRYSDPFKRGSAQSYALTRQDAKPPADGLA